MHVPTPANKEQAVVIGTALYNPENLHLMASIVWHVIQYVIGNWFKKDKAKIKS